MGQKVNPKGLRIGVNKDWEANWFADKKDFGILLNKDDKIRKYIAKKMKDAAVAQVVIERTAKRTEVKIKFIDDNKTLYDVRLLCNCLNLHHSVYYYHCNHSTNSYKIANQNLDIEIKKIYDESKGRYGSPKITKVLNNKDIKVSQKRVARRMKTLGCKKYYCKKI